MCGTLATHDGEDVMTPFGYHQIGSGIDPANSGDGPESEVLERLSAMLPVGVEAVEDDERGIVSQVTGHDCLGVDECDPDICVCDCTEVDAQGECACYGEDSRV